MAQRLGTLIALPEDRGSVPSTNLMSCKCLYLQFQGIQWLLPALAGTSHMWGTEIHAGRQNTYIQKLKIIQQYKIAKLSKMKVQSEVFTSMNFTYYWPALGNVHILSWRTDTCSAEFSLKCLVFPPSLTSLMCYKSFHFYIFFQFWDDSIITSFLPFYSSL